MNRQQYRLIGVLLGMLTTGAWAADKRADAPNLSLREPITAVIKTTGAHPRKIAMGERLFHDPRLSSDSRRACATCHPLADGGMDRQSHAVTLNNTRVTLNTPSVFNAVLSSSIGWLGAARSIGEHIDAVVVDTAVFNTDWPSLVQRVSQDSAYLAGFKAIYDAEPLPEHIRDVLSIYLGTLVTPRSRFDRYLQGELDALTADERQGYAEFKAHGCIACHQGVNIGGNVFQRFGVFDNYFAARESAQPADAGRFLMTGRERDRQVFRVPSLRNVAQTAPYFHDGSATTLEEAVKVMAHYQLGQTPSDDEIHVIAGFLRTLTGEFPERGR